ncbi:MAG: hypothetical protein JNK82_18930 [Myxococcaceae bacterium]|nr:hypothetical protein [Myxococcaceae bacterium]
MRRDALSDAVTLFAASNDGTVVGLSGAQPTQLVVSLNRGTHFRRVGSINAAGILRPPSWVGSRAGGGNHFAMSSSSSAPHWLTLDANGALLAWGTASTPQGVGLAQLAGCQGPGGNGAVGFSSNGLLRSTDEGRSYQAVALPAGIPPASVMVDIAARGAHVVVLASNGIANATLLRSTDCGASWAAMPLSGAPANTTMTRVSVGSDTRAWLLATEGVSNGVVASLTFSGSGVMGTFVTQASPTAFRGIAGNDQSSVVIAGARGALASTGSFPSMASRRSEYISELGALSVRRDTPANMAEASSVVVLGATNGRVWFSSNSGVTWAPAPIPNGGLVTGIHATNQAFGGIAAIESGNKVWINPQTGWLQGSYTPAPSQFSSITCDGASCMAAGTDGAIGVISYLGSLSSGFAVTAQPGSNLTWSDIDRVGSVYTVVGRNAAGQGFSSVRMSSTFSTPSMSTPLPLYAIALKRDGSGEAIAVGQGGISLSSDFGATFPTTIPTAGAAMLDITHLAGTNVWVAVGQNGLVRHITRTSATTAAWVDVPIGTGTTLYSVDASDSRSDLVWVAAADGTVFVSTVGARP